MSLLLSMSGVSCAWQIHGLSFLVGVAVMLASTLHYPPIKNPAFQFTGLRYRMVASLHFQHRLITWMHFVAMPEAPATMLRSVVQDEVATITSLGRSEAQCREHAGASKVRRTRL